MNILDAEQILGALNRLRKSKISVFGSGSHHFELEPTTGEAAVKAFENRHGIRLPSEYRDFIVRIGNGGAGPYYGVFPLGMMDDSGNKYQVWQERNGFVGILSEPFPLREAWNDISEIPSPALAASDEEEYERQMDIYERKHWDPARVNGAIPICHMGCALRVWLVVTGEESGHLWRDGRTDDSGISPLTTKERARATFGNWYREWLEEVLSRLPRG
jgi:hypothetical protein